MKYKQKIFILSILLLTVSIMLSGCTDTASVKNTTDKVNNTEIKTNIEDTNFKINNSTSSTTINETTENITAVNTPSVITTQNKISKSGSSSSGSSSSGSSSSGSSSSGSSSSGSSSSGSSSSGSSSSGSSSSNDLFPNKINVKYAKGFNVEYHDNYKLVTVNDAKEGKTFKYALVQNGTTPPTVDIDTQIIDIPLKNIVTMSSTQFQALEIMGELDKLVGISSHKYIYSPSLRQFIQDHNIPEVTSGDGMSPALNTELLVQMSPSIVMVSASGGSTGSDTTMDTLKNVGINYVVNSDWLEETPLGRTEWIKFESLFFNKEKEANDYFTQTEMNYNNVKARTSYLTDVPTVMSGQATQGQWYVPGGNSYVATFIKDAGGNYLWSDDTSTGSLPLDYEAVFNKAKDSQYWFSTYGSWNTTDDMKKEDPLYMNFTPTQTGNVFTFTARVSESGSNDYWESGIMKPDIILKDYVKALHPELVPNHNFVYCKQVIKSDDTTATNNSSA